MSFSSFLAERGDAPVKAAQTKQKKSGGILSVAADLSKNTFGKVGNFLFGGATETLAKPFVETIAASNELVGKQAPEWTQSRRLKTPELAAFDKYGVGSDTARAATAAEINDMKSKGYKGAGFTDVLNVASLTPGVGLVAKGAQTASRAGQVASGTVKAGSALLNSAKAIAPAATAWGAGYGLAGAVDQRKPFGEAVADTAVGAGVGLASGLALSAGSTLVGKALNKTKQIIDKDFKKKNIVDNRQAALADIESNNGPVRKILAQAKEKGIDTKRILAETDLLVGAVDKDGTIRTTQEGGPVQQLQEFLQQGPESVVSTNLAREGKKISLVDVEKKLRDAVNASKISGADKIAALNQVKREVAGLRIGTAKDGMIDLSKIHDAKTYKYGNINYLNPASKNTDKLIAKALKELVEDGTESIDVRRLNAELSAHYSVLKLLEALDGKKVKGGRLGKYFAQTLGAVVGSKLGPLGAIAGAEVGGSIQGARMASTFGDEIGAVLGISKSMDDAIKLGNSPKPTGPKPLMLPAPDSSKTGPTINLPGPTTFEPQAKIIGTQKRGPLTAEEFLGEVNANTSLVPEDRRLPTPDRTKSGPTIPLRGPTIIEGRAKIVGTQPKGIFSKASVAKKTQAPKQAPLGIDDFMDGKAPKKVVVGIDELNWDTIPEEGVRVDIPPKSQLTDIWNRSHGK